MKKFRLLTAALCAVVLLCGFSTTAYAGGGDEWEGLDPAEPLPVETPEPGEGFSEEGNLVTRDLLYDKHTNKQFITVQTSGGSTFYIVIDYDKPTDEDGEQFETYFLNVVDEADLLAVIEAAGGEVPACACSEKCAAGAVNTACPVCAVNMGECAGTAPEPEPAPEPTPTPEPEPEQKNGAGTLILALAVVLIGGGAAFYFKVYRPKQQRAAVQEDYGEGEYEGYDDEDSYDDGPPWDEDEPGEGDVE